MSSNSILSYFVRGDRPLLCAAPMVYGSDLPFRLLCRQRGAVDVCWTPMLAAPLFHRSKQYRKTHFQTCKEDTPLVIQIGGGNEEVRLFI